MTIEPGLNVTKPIALWNKPLKVDFRELFKALGKGVINGISANWSGLASDVVDASAALGLDNDPGQVAWLLIFRSLKNAIVLLVQDNKELFVKQPQNLNRLCDYLDLSLEETELTIDSNFFKNPKQLPILETLQKPFCQWLNGFVETEAQARAMSSRLPTYFVFALNEEWRSRSEQYSLLKEHFDTPLTKASEREQAWLRYRAWLQKQIEEPMFLEAFGLKQVYVPLCGYYTRKKQTEEREYRMTDGEKSSEERIVIELDAALQSWLDKADREDAIRVICGGPGCGKSSFTKMLAAKLAETGQLPVLFIPLHQFEPESDLIEAISSFIRSDLDGLLPPNPLEKDNLEQRLLLVFDGLDELAMQGKVGTEVAQAFVREVQKKVDRFNSQTIRLQVLISGRDLAVQATSNEFRKEGQILHVLPYFILEKEQYFDPQELLNEDRRHQWWRKYGEASGKGYKGLPKDLDRDNLTEITAQPLLNYLVSLSYRRGTLKISETSNLNEIYADLLDAVYKRDWAGYQHPTLHGIKPDLFERILEEIALSSWHGDGRTTTVKEVEAHCDNIGLKQLLDIFQEQAEKGVTRLLTAFYFRQCGLREVEKTFEFTHKSFGEYLTAKRIIRGIKRIDDELESRRQDLDRGWDERQALHHWATLCGASAMDEYLFQFICEEMQLQDKNTVSQWQETLCRLIEVMLRRGMPMEQLNPRPNYHEESRQARNAEEALLAVLNACARFTGNLSHIDWPTPEAFGNWLARLQGQRITWSKNTLALSCLGFLDLQKCILFNRDLQGARLDGARLDGASLDGARLDWARLDGARLDGARLDGANLRGARLDGANLEGAWLYGARLYGARLYGANLNGANLEGASLVGARLEGASLVGASLVGARLEGARLEGASLERASLEGASLERASLEDISWNECTNWNDVRGIELARNVPLAIKRQLGIE